MDFFINLGETTLKTQYCRDHKSVKILLKTGLDKSQKLLLEIFGVPRDCKKNLLLTDYEIVTMDDHYIGLKPFALGRRRFANERIILVILPTSALNSKPYNDPKMNRYQYYIRRSTVNNYFGIKTYPIDDPVYDKEVHIYDLSFDSYIGRHEFIAGISHREIKGKELFLK